jgi:hypothetical protein
MTLFKEESPYNQLIKTATYFPITIDEAKRHLRVDEDFDLDDDYISGLIQAGTKRAEQFCGKDISFTDNVLTLDDFYGSSISYDEGNFYSLTSVIDTDTSTAFTAAKTRAYRNSFYIEFADTISGSPLVVTFKTGFNVGQCPADIKQAILIKIGDLYDMERQNYTFSSYKDTGAFERLLDPHKILVF